MILVDRPRRAMFRIKRGMQILYREKFTILKNKKDQKVEMERYTMDSDYMESFPIQDEDYKTSISGYVAKGYFSLL